MSTQNYFSTCSTVEEVKRLYRTLAMKHHPDRGGDTATMQAINAQYTAALKKLDGQKSTSDDGREHTYKYDAAKEQAIMDKMQETLKAGIIKGDIDLWLVGTWIWVQGDTKPVKDTLKELGYKWHSKRVCWYWQNDGYRHSYSNADFVSLAYKYGATRFKSQVEKELV